MAIGSGLRTPSLRRRLVVGIVVTASIASFAEALLLHVVWYGYERRLIERVVEDELRRSIEIHPRDRLLAYPNTGDLRLFVASRDPTLPSDPLPPYLAPLRDVSGDVPGSIVFREVRAADGVDYQVGIAQRGPLAFLLAYDASEHQQRRIDLLWAVLAIAMMLTLLASRLALGLVERLMGGMNRLQRRITEGPGSTTFRDAAMDVEVSALADALDDHRRQVAIALRKERAFAAAASHELRTPLTRIATGTEMLLARNDLPDAVLSRLNSVRDSVDELQRLLGVLLLVARWQPAGDRPSPLPPEGAPRPLGELVGLCIARLAGEARLLGTSVSVSLAEPDRPILHPAMLEIVLSNLLRNAIRHGRSAPVEVRGENGAIEVVDRGPGIEAAALERVFDPFWRGSAADDETGPSGLGLGLTIAERICAAAGWVLSIRSDAGSGTRVSVRLAAAGQVPDGEAPSP
ncbi:MAG: sensor histidine kinase [Burkholderiales bacterium]|nr:MAG: sensor histidine kinase [Burkholderiales bacterium]